MAAAVVALGGCGGSTDNSSNESGETRYTVQAATDVTTGSFTKAQFIKHANAICRRSHGQIEMYYKRYAKEQKPGTSDEDVYAGAMQALIIPGIQFEFDYIRALGGPKGEERDVEDMVGTMQYAIETGQKSSTITTFEDLREQFADYNVLVRRFGINRCLIDKVPFAELKQIHAST